VYIRVYPPLLPQLMYPNDCVQCHNITSVVVGTLTSIVRISLWAYVSVGCGVLFRCLGTATGK
jgi:hypothetical protein